MANTRYLRETVEGFVRGELEEEFGQPFSSVVLPLGSGGVHEFDAVSQDRQIVASVKSASGLTATGKIPSGKIMSSTAELYFLSLVDAPSRMLVLTTPAFHEIFCKVMKGKVAPGLYVRCIPLPTEIQLAVDKIVAEASAEVSPALATKAVAAELEAELHQRQSNL